jgi:hypothetical protein
MKESKRRPYCEVFGAQIDAEFYFCGSCNEYFAEMPHIPHVDNSNRSMKEKLHTMVEKCPEVSSWLFPGNSKNLTLVDEESNCCFIGEVHIPATDIIKKYLHFKLNETACSLCTTSYALFRALWLQQPVGKFLTFVHEARNANLSRQTEMVSQLLELCDDVGGDTEEFDVEVLKGTLKKKDSSRCFQACMMLLLHPPMVL